VDDKARGDGTYKHADGATYGGLVDGSKINNMDPVSRNSRMVPNMRANIKMGRSMAMGNYRSLMEVLILDNFQVMKYQVLENMSDQKVKGMKERGPILDPLATVFSRPEELEVLESLKRRPTTEE
jgi:hypothetical protein